MSNAQACHQWMVENFEKPFLKIEMLGYEISREASGQDSQGAGVLTLISAYAAVFTGLCVYWFVKYVIG